MSKALAKQYGLSPSGIVYRKANGISLDAPIAKRGNYRGGNLLINEQTAKAIWADLQLVKSKKLKLTHAQLAEKHGTTKACVKNISVGQAWNHVTGLPKKQYGDY